MYIRHQIFIFINIYTYITTGTNTRVRRKRNVGTAKVHVYFPPLCFFTAGQSGREPSQNPVRLWVMKRSSWWSDRKTGTKRLDQSRERHGFDGWKEEDEKENETGRWNKIWWSNLSPSYNHHCCCHRRIFSLSGRRRWNNMNLLHIMWKILKL